ncbi:MAG: hypothetical protein KGJ60_14760 [Verrucomicrobiota bacterium]|nr:hypothetical protein [Verrucomicrobiota bacterium]
MPIRINLLAEAQAVEASRRRDPVKLAILAGVLLVALTLVWSSFLQLKTMLAGSALTQMQADIQSRTKQFDRAMEAHKRVDDAQARLQALQRLAADRFLNGDLLDALQHTTVPGVALMRLRVQQSYLLAAGVPAQTNGSRVLPGKPPTVTEQIVLTLDARDSSANPGDAVNKFKEALAENRYFKTMLDETNGIRLTDLSAPQMGSDGKMFVLFTMQCRYNAHTR